MPPTFWMKAPRPLITPDTPCVLPAVLMPCTVPAVAILFEKTPLFTRLMSRNAPEFTVTALPPLMLPIVPLPIWRWPAVTSVAPV